jgi:hypothetical protein
VSTALLDSALFRIALHDQRSKHQGSGYIFGIRCRVA